MTTRILDRRIGKEPSNRPFGIRAQIEDVPTGAVYWPQGALGLDQLNTGHCVGMGCAGEAADSPVRVRGVDASYGHEWYYEIKRKRYDPFGLEEGSTVNAGMHVGRDRGLWDGWRWAFGIEDVKRALIVGPVVIGIGWTTRMFTPDGSGFIVPAGADEGGHCLRVNGWSPNFHAGGRSHGSTFRLPNTWGLGWGIRGRCYMHEDDLAERLANDGEAAVAVGRHLPS